MDVDPTKPILNSTIIVAFVASLITLLAAFGLPVTDAQTEAILAFIPSAWVLGLAIYALSKPKVEEKADDIATQAIAMDYEVRNPATPRTAPRYSPTTSWRSVQEWIDTKRFA